jgi:hypothetical protein
MYAELDIEVRSCKNCCNEEAQTAQFSKKDIKKIVLRFLYTFVWNILIRTKWDVIKMYINQYVPYQLLTNK